MRYTRFEWLVIGVGGAAIAGSTLFSFGAAPMIQEIVAQFLLFAVLAAAVHWGRKGGFYAALAASTIYLVLRIPLVLDEQTLYLDVAALLVLRVLSYGLVGILGGELCGRIKYVFARFEDSESIDEWSHVYNQRFTLRALDNVLGQYSRYETPFSVVIINISQRVLDGLQSAKQQSIVRGLANNLRNDIRLVDEIGRLDDGRFLIVLPQTPRDGGKVVADRLKQGSCRFLGAKDESISVTALGAPEDLARLTTFRDSLVQEPAEDSQDQSESSGS